MIQKGERQSGLYYLYKSKNGHGIASTEYVHNLASDEDRERIIQDSMFESSQVLFNHIDYVNKRESEIQGSSSYVPYTIELSSDMFTNLLDDLANI